MTNTYKKANIVVFDEIFIRAQLPCIEHSILEKLSRNPNFSNAVLNAMPVFDCLQWSVGYMIYVTDQDSNICYLSHLAINEAFMACGLRLNATEVKLPKGVKYNSGMVADTLVTAMNEVMAKARSK